MLQFSVPQANIPPTAIPDVAVVVLVIVLLASFLLGIFFGRILRAVFLKRERSDAVKRSQSVILGGIYEKILPFLPGFQYSPKDGAEVDKVIIPIKFK